MSINFGLDPNENQKEESKFVWVKKHKKDSKKGISFEERERNDAVKKQEMEVIQTLFSLDSLIFIVGTGKAR